MIVANQGKIAFAHFVPAEPSVMLYNISKMASITFPMPLGTRSVCWLFLSERFAANPITNSRTIVTAKVGRVFTK